MKFNNTKIMRIALFLFVASLAACGGGGGTSAALGNNTGSNSTYAIGGMVTGLASGTSLVLQNNGGDDLSITANGTFVFATSLADTAAYAVTVLTQPAGQTCTVTNATGTVAGASVTNILVTCSAGGGTNTGGGSTTITSYTGTLQFDLSTGASGVANVTWTKFEDLGDTRRYLPSGNMLVDFNVQGCTPLLAQNIAIATSSAASPAETLVVYTSTNVAYPQQYQFTLTGAGNVTLQCGGSSVTMQASSLLPIIVGNCFGGPMPAFTNEALLDDTWSCSIVGVNSATWSFAGQ
jgi:hypothetical protein